MALLSWKQMTLTSPSCSRYLARAVVDQRRCRMGLFCQRPRAMAKVQAAWVPTSTKPVSKERLFRSMSQTDSLLSYQRWRMWKMFGRIGSIGSIKMNDRILPCSASNRTVAYPPIAIVSLNPPFSNPASPHLRRHRQSDPLSPLRTKGIAALLFPFQCRISSDLS